VCVLSVAVDEVDEAGEEGRGGGVRDGDGVGAPREEVGTGLGGRQIRDNPYDEMERRE